MSLSDAPLIIAMHVPRKARYKGSKETLEAEARQRRRRIG